MYKAFKDLVFESHTGLSRKKAQLTFENGIRISVVRFDKDPWSIAFRDTNKKNNQWVFTDIAKANINERFISKIMIDIQGLTQKQISHDFAGYCQKIIDIHSGTIKHPLWLIASCFFIILGLVHWGPFGIIIGIVCFAVWAQKEFKS